MELNYFFSNGGGLALFGVAGWAAILMFVIITLIAAWRMASYTNLAETSPYLEHLAHHIGEEATEADDAHGEQGSIPVDDLQRIEGIGPKISDLLNKAGIHTYRDLAETDVERLVEIMQGARITIADPTTWPEQAQRAAEGDWEALTEMQDALKGGRKV
jgi:predicted flap endonuclease-1-like 5' DNA nuclease